ncbi:MAG: DUF2029 domain-containing protein [Candidatus Omnitrophica bacterium]|nr:DUF2029 domain-containing protein [Candidatus Omnitrophota bacterium]
MLKSLRAKIIFSGLVLTGVWGGVTALSKGLPAFWCELLDRLTGHALTSQVMAMQNGFYYQVDNNEMPTTIFLILFFFAFALVCYLLIQMERSAADPAVLGWVLGFAVVFRVILLPGEPIHENDFYRYLWDGKSITHGINPFKYAPSDLFMYEYKYKEDYYDDSNAVLLTAKNFSAADAQRLDRLLVLRDENRLLYDRIGHWQVPTIYPPVAQAVFAVISGLREDSYVLMKLVFMLFDLGAIWITVLLLRHLGRDPALVMVYAWSPLVLKEFPNSGHYDPVAIFFTLLSVYWLLTRHHLKGYVALALATLAKFFSVILLPLFLRQTRWRLAPAFFAVIAFAYVPFLLWDHSSFAEIFQGLATYNEEWSYNSSVFAVIYRVMEEINAQWVNSLILPKIVAAGLYALFVMFLSFTRPRNREDLLHRIFLAIAGLFIINPVGDPWYFCWCIPFLCFFPYRSWILLSGTLILSYLNFQTVYPLVDADWWGIPALSYLIYGPFFAVLLMESARRPAYLRLG